MNAASEEFIAAIAARDIKAMEKLWAHEPYATFIGPDGRMLSFDAFVTNLFENRDGRWLVVAHHATPMFKGPE